jgi:hypothetical protein
MYNRSEKESYRKKIEELISGRQKRSRKDDNDNSSDDANYSNINENEDISMLSDDIRENVNTNDINGTRVEGIRKYLGINKINL